MGGGGRRGRRRAARGGAGPETCMYVCTGFWHVWQGGVESGAGFMKP